MDFEGRFGISSRFSCVYGCFSGEMNFTTFIFLLKRAEILQPVKSPQGGCHLCPSPCRDCTEEAGPVGLLCPGNSRDCPGGTVGKSDVIDLRRHCWTNVPFLRCSSRFSGSCREAFHQAKERPQQATCTGLWTWRTAWDDAREAPGPGLGTAGTQHMDDSGRRVKKEPAALTTPISQITSRGHRSVMWI